jgi:hypothetical protein
MYRDGSDKLVPFELRGNYRLKTIADIVICIQNLSNIALKNPLVLQNPFDRKILPAGHGLNGLIAAKRDRSPRFIETYLPFEGTFEHSIFRRGALSYDFTSSAVYNKLSNLKISSGKRALLRQHVIKSSAVEYEQERYARRHFLNPMRKHQPQPPTHDIVTLDKMFLENFETKSDSKKKKKKARKTKKVMTSVDDTQHLSVREQENSVREKIIKLREELLQQQEVIDALNGSTGKEGSDSDTSTSSSSTSDDESGGSSCGSSSTGEEDDDDDDDDDRSEVEDIIDEDTFASTFRALAPNSPAPSFQRRRNVSLAGLH